MIRERLRYIYTHRYTDTSHYYYTAKHFGGELPHEKPYAFADTVPKAYRLLALAKIQAAVDHIFPHKYLMDQNFDGLVRAALPRFEAADNRLAYEKELLLLTAHLNDTHTLRFYRSLKNWSKILQVKYYPPFDHQLVNKGTGILVTRIIIPELCQAAGIQKGDIITRINDQTVAARVAQLGRYLSASNPPALEARLNRYFDHLLLPTDSLHARLTYERDGKIRETTIEWTSKPADFKVLSAYVNAQMAPKASGTALEYAAPGVLIFRAGETTRFLRNFPEGHLEQAMDSLFRICAQQKGLIFDMRTYPDWGGFYHLTYNFFGQDRRFFAHYYGLDEQYMGQFKWLRDTITYYPPFTKPGGHSYLGKVVLLVNGETLSAGEYYTMYLQHIFPQSLTLGSPSAGADGDEKILTLPGGYELPFSGNAIFYPDGTAGQRKGVKIGRVLYPEPADLLADKDTQLEAALQFINGR